MGSRAKVTVLAAAALLAGAAAGAAAQTRDSALARLAGREVRFRTGLEERRGQLVRLDADSFVVHEGGASLALPRTGLVTLDVRRSGRTAGIVGGVLGVAAAALLMAGGECTTDSGEKCSAAEKAGMTVLFAGLAGGGAAWYLAHHPGWQRLIPASGAPGSIRLAEQPPPPLPAPAAELRAEARAQPAQAVRADTTRVAAPEPAPEMPASAVVGHWVRALVTTGAAREGVAVRVDTASLVLAGNGHGRDSVVVPRASIAELWVSRADRPMTGAGVVMGGIVGGLAGLGVGVLGAQAAARYSPGDPGLIFVAPAIIFASLAVCGSAGMLLGGLIGAHTMQRDWQAVATPPQLTLQPGGRARVAVTVSLSAGSR